MPNAIPYKSYCWSLGTTSFRTKNFNKTIEEQLALLDGFWQLPENQDGVWNGNNELQSRYYDYMQQMGFVEGNAGNKPKDAREKTSGLVDIGLVGDDRHLTNAGVSLLEICATNDFSADNFFDIPKDSYLYLRQLLKTSYNIDGSDVRPFIILLYVLSKVSSLSLDEFTYLLPLCTSDDNTEEIICGIESVRRGTATIDEIILERLMQKDNYQAALTLLLNNEVDEALMCEVGINRKSRQYDKVYYPLYQHLYSAYIDNDSAAFSSVFLATKDVKIGKLWRSYLFDTVSEVAISRNPNEHKNSTLFDNVTNEQEFKTAFFKVMHLLKARATLSDYLDLNRRYIKTTDIVLFEDNVVKLDIVPKHFFGSVINELYNQAYTQNVLLVHDCAINDIDPCLVVDEQAVVDGVNEELGVTVTNIAEARAVLEDNRYERLHHLINTKFSNAQIINLLDCFESRNDTEIRNMVTDNADIPTIFEYVLGIMWYKLSEYQGKILDYMKLSLDADLLPKTHAAGGEADIVYEYPITEYYPAHTMLLEATLSDGTNQRRMEMEPVSRHLGRHLIRTRNMNSYCVFATNYLDINVISDFRSRKTTPYYDPQDYAQYVNGMKIIPLQTSELKSMLLSGKTYKELYNIFEEAYNSEFPPHEWYERCIFKTTK